MSVALPTWKAIGGYAFKLRFLAAVRKTFLRPAANRPSEAILIASFHSPAWQITFHEARNFTSASSPSGGITPEVSTGSDWHFYCAIEATYLDDHAMIRIETTERRDPRSVVVLVLPLQAAAETFSQAR